MNFNEKLEFSKLQWSWNLFTCHKINLRLISVGFLRFHSLLRFMESQSGLMSSLLIRSSFLKNQIFKDKKQNAIEIWTALIMICWFLPIISFHTIQCHLLRPRKTWPSWKDKSWSTFCQVCFKLNKY